MNTQQNLLIKNTCEKIAELIQKQAEENGVFGTSSVDFLLNILEKCTVTSFLSIYAMIHGNDDACKSLEKDLLRYLANIKKGFDDQKETIYAQIEKEMSNASVH